MRSFAVILSALAAVGVMACDNASSPTPAAPSAGTPAISTLTINGVPLSLAIGQAVQLSVTATSSGGTTSPASNVTWASVDTKVASVSAGGLLTAAGAGQTDISATVEGVRGTAHVTVAPQPLPSTMGYDIAGVVHESAPTDNIRLAGATVGIHFVDCPACPHDNQTTTTDSEGRFLFVAVEQAGFSLVVSKEGYETRSYAVAELPRDRHPDIAVLPVRRTIQETHEGATCPSSLSFAVHHDGPLTFEECRNTAFQGQVQLFQADGNIEVAHQPCTQFTPPPQFPPLKGGFVYRLRIGGDACFVTDTFRAVFSHPN